MNLGWRLTKALGKNLRVSLGKSGPSASVRVGPLTVSSRRRASVRLGRGFSWRGRL